VQLTGPLLVEALQHYQRGDLHAAEAILARMPDHASALHLLGVLRVQQRRLNEAAEFLIRSVEIQPREAQSQFNLGKVLSALGRQSEASEALRAALTLDPALVDAALVLGKSLHAQGYVNKAIDAYRDFLAVRPLHAPAKCALGNALIAVGRPQEADPLLTAALDETSDPCLRADLHQALAYIHRKRRPSKALEHVEQARALDSSRVSLEFDRAVLLEEVHRFDDAKAAYEGILAREPVNALTHYSYNELLYRLSDDVEFLASYERAPRTEELMLAKALFLLNAGRFEDAKRCYSDILARYSDNRQAVLGVGLALVRSGKVSEAVLAFESAAQRYPDSVEVHCNLAGALAQSGDPQKAITMAAKALEIEPGNQIALAILGTSWRLMGDPRDEVLNGYDDFIRVFDLEQPEGFSDMESFNSELSDYLKAMHPPVREYLRQSLRGGTQTSDNLFDAGHALVEKIQSRIAQAVGRYVDSLKSDDRHPYLSRKRNGFEFAGSWSSRLRDRGFHINHLHPGGWISSCYYVDLPNVMKDGMGQQGWIKFGEPSFDVGLPPRRVIQPTAGRLVLFPSYMWHGTVPFQGSDARTTIAFDVLPS
jgi:tetratricopeptide (TPR) repeat protein